MIKLVMTNAAIVTETIAKAVHLLLITTFLFFRAEAQQQRTAIKRMSKVKVDNEKKTITKMWHTNVPNLN